MSRLEESERYRQRQFAELRRLTKLCKTTGGLIIHGRVLVDLVDDLLDDEGVEE